MSERVNEWANGVLDVCVCMCVPVLVCAVFSDVRFVLLFPIYNIGIGIGISVPPKKQRSSIDPKDYVGVCLWFMVQHRFNYGGVNEECGQLFSGRERVNQRKNILVLNIYIWISPSQLHFLRLFSGLHTAFPADDECCKVRLNLNRCHVWISCSQKKNK